MFHLYEFLTQVNNRSLTLPIHIIHIKSFPIQDSPFHTHSELRLTSTANIHS